jgi:transcriptional regulator
MYLRPVFTVTDLDRIAALIAANPFGVLVTHGPAGMDASHIPFAVERDGDHLVLTAHLGAPNAQCALLDGGTALAIFSGPHAYITPTWYITQPAVPTWDYVAAHVHGRLEAVADPSEGLRSLATHDPGAFDMDAMPERYRESMFRGIRAFRLRGERIEAQWKMSQNRSVADRRQVIEALRARGETTVADLIEETIVSPP